MCPLLLLLLLLLLLPPVCGVALETGGAVDCVGCDEIDPELE